MRTRLPARVASLLVGLRKDPAALGAEQEQRTVEDLLRHLLPATDQGGAGDDDVALHRLLGWLRLRLRLWRGLHRRLGLLTAASAQAACRFGCSSISDPGSPRSGPCRELAAEFASHSRGVQESTSWVVTSCFVDFGQAGARNRNACSTVGRAAPPTCTELVQCQAATRSEACACVRAPRAGRSRCACTEWAGQGNAVATRCANVGDDWRAGGCGDGVAACREDRAGR